MPILLAIYFKYILFLQISFGWELKVKFYNENIFPWNQPPKMSNFGRFCPILKNGKN